MGCLGNNFIKNGLFSQLIDAFGEFAFHVGRFVLVDDAFFGQFVDLGGHIRENVSGFFLNLDYPQVANGVTGSFTIITVAIPAFVCLTNIFFCCFMIGHELEILGRQRYDRPVNIPKVYA